MHFERASWIKHEKFHLISLFMRDLTQLFKFSENRANVLRNVLWAVLGKVINVISGIFVGVLVARYLGPENFGVMNYVISFVALFSVFSSFGLDNIEIRELAKVGAKKETILGTAFILRVVFALITMLLIVAVLVLFEPDSKIVYYVLIYSLSLLLNSLVVVRNYFTSIVMNEYVVKTEIMRTILGALIKIVLLLNHASLLWFIIANAFDFVLISSGYLVSYLKKVGQVRLWKFDLNVAKLLIKESFPLLISGTAIVIYQKIDTVMIKNMLGAGSVGQYSVASTITDFVIFVPMVIAQTVTPLLVKAHQDDLAVYRIKRLQFMDVMVWASFLMALFISLASGLAISMLYGSKYAAAIPVTQIMAWKAVFMALFAASGQLIIIENIQKYAAVRNILGCFVSVILNFLLIPYLGIIGSAISTLMTMFFSGYISHLFIKPYKELFWLQTDALLLGWMRLYRTGFRKVFT